MASEVFRYVEADHSYWLNDQRIRGLSELLDLGGLVTAKDYYTEASRVRGSEVHRMAMNHDLGALSAKELADSQYRGYGCAYVSAVAAMQPTTLSGEPGWEEIEIADYHPTFRYGCRKDRLGIVRFKGEKVGRRSIVEVKSGAKCEKAHGAQLALQAIVAEVRYGLPAKMWQRIALHLTDTGRWTPWVYEDHRDFDQAHNLIGRFCK